MQEKIVLDNGLRVILLPVDGAKSASVGIWIEAGSRYEKEHEQGVSHFVEHMLFKGTARRTARGISEEMDSLGGGLNAYTAREYTRYYAQTLAENAEKAFDILCDMVMNAQIDDAQLELERGVILDEIAMYEDSGEDVAQEALVRAVWPSSPLGQPIAGTRESVAALDSAALRQYMKEYYTPDRMIAVVAGGFDRRGIISLLEGTLGTLARGGSKADSGAPVFTSTVVLTKKDFEQTSLILAMPGPVLNDPRKHAMAVANFIIGGGASSRLFQRLREELGLAYSVYSSHSASIDAGLFTVSASFSSAGQEQVLTEIDEVLSSVQNQITQEEFERARAQIKASYIMGLETVSSKASFAGRNELFEGRCINAEDEISALDALRLEDILKITADILGSKERAVSVAGDTMPRTFYDRFIISS